MVLVKMNEWKILNQKTIDTFNNNFIEVNLKQAPEGKNIFLGLSKGWRKENGEKMYKANILFTKDKKDEIISALQSIDEGVEIPDVEEEKSE
jgi:hypothetical protein